MDESFQFFLQRSCQFLRFVFDEFFLGGEICISDKEIKNFQRILLIVENLQYCPKKHFHPCKTTGPCCLSTDGLVVCLQMALLFVYRWPCCLSTDGLVVCLQRALLFVYRGPCCLSTEGLVVCLQRALLFVYRWPCCLSTDGLVVCLQMALLFVYRWPCCLSTEGLVVCLQMALLFVYRCLQSCINILIHCQLWYTCHFKSYLCGSCM